MKKQEHTNLDNLFCFFLVGKFYFYLHFRLYQSRFLILIFRALLMYVSLCIKCATSFEVASHVLLSFCEFSFFICSYNDFIIFFFWLLCTRAYTRKKGRNNVTVDDLVHVITPKGRGRFIFSFFLPKCLQFLAFFFPHSVPLSLTLLTRWEHLPT